MREIEEKLVQTLAEMGLTISTAESCTGGMVASTIIDVPGASDVYSEGFITYSDEAKTKYVHVKPETLEKYGAVSEQTAKEMVKGVAIGNNVDTAISITGIAGPDGGTEEKPVGLVYIGCYVNEKVTIKKCNFAGNRQKVREYSVITALDLLRRCIIENYS